MGYRSDLRAAHARIEQLEKELKESIQKGLKEPKKKAPKEPLQFYRWWQENWGLVVGPIVVVAMIGILVAGVGANIYDARHGPSYEDCLRAVEYRSLECSPGTVKNRMMGDVCSCILENGPYFEFHYSLPLGRE